MFSIYTIQITDGTASRITIYLHIFEMNVPARRGQFVDIELLSWKYKRSKNVNPTFMVSKTVAVDCKSWFWEFRVIRQRRRKTKSYNPMNSVWSTLLSAKSKSVNVYECHTLKSGFRFLNWLNTSNFNVPWKQGQRKYYSFITDNLPCLEALTMDLLLAYSRQFTWTWEQGYWKIKY